MSNYSDPLRTGAIFKYSSPSLKMNKTSISNARTIDSVLLKNAAIIRSEFEKTFQRMTPVITNDINLPLSVLSLKNRFIEDYSYNNNFTVLDKNTIQRSSNLPYTDSSVNTTTSRNLTVCSSVVNNQFLIPGNIGQSLVTVSVQNKPIENTHEIPNNICSISREQGMISNMAYCTPLDMFHKKVNEASFGDKILYDESSKFDAPTTHDSVPKLSDCPKIKSGGRATRVKDTLANIGILSQPKKSVTSENNKNSLETTQRNKEIVSRSNENSLSANSNDFKRAAIVTATNSTTSCPNPLTRTLPSNSITLTNSIAKDQLLLPPPSRMKCKDSEDVSAHHHPLSLATKSDNKANKSLLDNEVGHKKNMITSAVIPTGTTNRGTNNTNAPVQNSSSSKTISSPTKSVKHSNEINGDNANTNKDKNLLKKYSSKVLVANNHHSERAHSSPSNGHAAAPVSVSVSVPPPVPEATDTHTSHKYKNASKTNKNTTATTAATSNRKRSRLDISDSGSSSSSGGDFSDDKNKVLTKRVKPNPAVTVSSNSRCNTNNRSRLHKVSDTIDKNAADNINGSNTNDNSTSRSKINNNSSSSSSSNNKEPNTSTKKSSTKPPDNSSPKAEVTTKPPPPIPPPVRQTTQKAPPTNQVPITTPAPPLAKHPVQSLNINERVVASLPIPPPAVVAVAVASPSTSLALHLPSGVPSSRPVVTREESIIKDWGVVTSKTKTKNRKNPVTSTIACNSTVTDPYDNKSPQRLHRANTLPATASASAAGGAVPQKPATTTTTAALSSSGYEWSERDWSLLMRAHLMTPPNAPDFWELVAQRIACTPTPKSSSVPPVRRTAEECQHKWFESVELEEKKHEQQRLLKSQAYRNDRLTAIMQEKRNEELEELGFRIKKRGASASLSLRDDETGAGDGAGDGDGCNAMVDPKDVTAPPPPPPPPPKKKMRVSRADVKALSESITSRSSPSDIFRDRNKIGSSLESKNEDWKSVVNDSVFDIKSPQDLLPQSTRKTTIPKSSNMPRSSNRNSKQVYYGEEEDDGDEEEEEEGGELSTFSGGDAAWRAGYVHSLQTRRRNNNNNNSSNNNNSNSKSLVVKSPVSPSTLTTSKSRINSTLLSSSSSSRADSSSYGSRVGGSHMGYESKVGKVGARLSYNGTVKVSVDRESSECDYSEDIDDSEFDNDYDEADDD